MTQTYKKKLIEVAMPLEAINAASAREKSIRHGHPSTLHLYWARRPLAACRAVIFAQLVDDPSAHPDKFPTEADQQKERERLFKIIEELVIWENSTNEEVLKRARDEILKSCDGELPAIYDPFSGGGSIPLEAQRLGLPSFGSDLNPVAVMIGKAMVEIPQKFSGESPIHAGVKEKLSYSKAEGLAEDVKYYGEWIREKAFKKIGNLYPKIELPAEQGGGFVTPIAWIWARTVPCPDPAFAHFETPLVSTFVLSSRQKQKIIAVPQVFKEKGKIEYLIDANPSAEAFETAKRGTKSSRGANFTCLLSGAALNPEYIKQCGQSGKLGSKLIAVVASSNKGRLYFSANAKQETIADVQFEKSEYSTPLPRHPQYIGVLGYGFTDFEDLFSKRQRLALSTFANLLNELEEKITEDCNGKAKEDYIAAIKLYLTFAIGKCSDYWSSTCSWHNGRETIGHTFTRQAIPMTWDYVEANPFSASSGNWTGMLSWVIKALEQLPGGEPGSLKQIDARDITYPKNAVISSDPPYYDNIGYADLSDYFYSWFKPCLKKDFPEIFSTLTTPKSSELVADRIRHNGKENADDFFLDGMKEVFSNYSNQITNNYPAAIYYAFKQSEISTDGTASTGWATFLEALIQSGNSIVGTWPVRTELANRMRSIGYNALANSVVLVCRKRLEKTEVITRAEFVRRLKVELPKAVSDLKKANIAPADIPQSSIGPGIGIFSRYDAVLESDDTPMTVKTALQLINRELGAEEGDYDSETSFALTWFEQFGFNVSDYGTANNIANAKGIAVDALTHAGIAQSAGGKFSLLSRDSLEAGWDPDRDKTVTIWECCQYLCRRLENRGEFEAAKLMRRMGPERADAAKELAYALYDIAANKLNDATEATSYNSLISAWSELTVQAANMTDQDVSGDAQGRLL